VGEHGAGRRARDAAHGRLTSGSSRQFVRRERGAIVGSRGYAGNGLALPDAMIRTKKSKPTARPLDPKALARVTGGVPHDTHEIEDVSFTFDKIVHDHK
jgi:hypothetical protein